MLHCVRNDGEGRDDGCCNCEASAVAISMTRKREIASLRLQ
ncbi:MAG: hypothetical protein PHQ93_10470 [Sulfurimonas sp.]|nr:hypothetical protein [Sulfurimonas sp.]MDD5401601.1 hypothetical protein [Sulfurimonas sp.]